MEKKYCLPIIKNKKNDVLDVIYTNITDYSYFEVWLDYIVDLDEKFIKDLMRQFENKLIILFRRKNLETMQMNLQKRLQIISLLKNNDIFLDLDISSQIEELNIIKNNLTGFKMIVSYHNYDETPIDEKLHQIINTMNEYNPTIYKIATMCNNPSDAIRLLQLNLMLNKEDKKYLVVGMGEAGIITRIFGSLWGNEMIFAPRQDNEQSAKGQLTRNQLEVILNILNY